MYQKKTVLFIELLNIKIGDKWQKKKKKNFLFFSFYQILLIIQNRKYPKKEVTK